MSDLSGGYRQKYRQALDDQERAERQFAAHIDVFRKTLIALSSAVQGLDKPLDAALIQLKDRLRRASGAQVFEQMERVQRALTMFEQSREKENSEAARRLSALVEHLLELALPKDLEKSLKVFNSGVRKRMSSYRNYPVVIEELCKLHKVALDAASEPPSSFWARLRSGTRLKKENGAEQEQGQELQVEEVSGENGFEAAEGETVSVEMSSDVSEFQIEQEELVGDGVENDLNDRLLQDVISRREEAEQAAKALADQDSFEQVARRIVVTLRHLVDSIEPNNIVKNKVEIVQARLNRGIDWYALAVTLEDIRDILMQRYLDVDKEFSDYLKRVESELQVIGEALGLAVSSNDEKQNAANVFSSAVSAQVSKMRDSMQESSSLEGLKQNVSDHLSAIQEALSDFQHQQERHTSLSEQLKELVDRVQSVEIESVKAKEQLEEERYRATHDPLTGLPNREAYNERAFDEFQRFRRYSRPLALAICDIDFFKKINDTYGHQAGDRVLKLIAKVVSTRMRKVDFVGRYGGEEFVLLLPETTPEQAFAVLDKIRDAVGTTPFRFKESPVQITISFGIADFGPEDTVESVFERADKALYKAKGQGRNCCVVADREEGSA